jgi:hypothetical protein
MDTVKFQVDNSTEKLTGTIIFFGCLLF